MLTQSTTIGDREVLRQYARTYSVKRIGQEIGWTDEYIRSVIDGMDGCQFFWRAFETFARNVGHKEVAR